MKETIDILRSLVGFPTVSSDSNLALIEWIEKYLDEQNVPHWRVNESKNKSSLLARVGPETEGGIVLSGHTDVVPVREQKWDTDPFALTEHNDKFYGRGTSDMKSFIALALSHVAHFKKSKKPVWFAFSHDEEVGCLGAVPMAKALIAHNVDPSLVVIGEPTNMELIGAHKGIISFETIVTGHEAHSSMPEQGVNAVMLMAELIITLNRIAENAKAKADAASGFTTPYTTVHVGVMEGGTARNIIPARARIAWEVRPLPGEDVELLLKPFHDKVAELEKRMKKVRASAGIVTRQLTHVFGLNPVSDAPHMAIAHHLAQTNNSGAVAFGTEGGIFQSQGLPVVICGPGSIDQAHQPNEFITRDQLEKGAAFMQRVATCQA